MSPAEAPAVETPAVAGADGTSPPTSETPAAGGDEPVAEAPEVVVPNAHTNAGSPEEVEVDNKLKEFINDATRLRSDSLSMVEALAATPDDAGPAVETAETASEVAPTTDSPQVDGAPNTTTPPATAEDPAVNAALQTQIAAAEVAREDTVRALRALAALPPPPSPVKPAGPAAPQKPPPEAPSTPSRATQASAVAISTPNAVAAAPSKPSSEGGTTPMATNASFEAPGATNGQVTPLKTHTPGKKEKEVTLGEEPDPIPNHRDLPSEKTSLLAGSGESKQAKKEEPGCCCTIS